MAGRHWFHEYPRLVPLNRADLEQELAFQLREIQRLLAENRHITDGNVMLERNLCAVKEEILILNVVLGEDRADRDTHTRELMERGLKMRDDLHLFEPLMADIKQLRGEMQNLEFQKQELFSQFQSLNENIDRLKSENDQVTLMKAEVDEMQKELIEARKIYECEKKGNEELVEQNRAMKRNLISMTNEIELLRAEKITANWRVRGIEGLGMVNGSHEQYPNSEAYSKT